MLSTCTNTMKQIYYNIIQPYCTQLVKHKRSTSISVCMYVCTIYSNIHVPVYRRDSTTQCQGSPTGLGTDRRCGTLYHTHHKATSGESQSFKKRIIQLVPYAKYTK